MRFLLKFQCDNCQQNVVENPPGSVGTDMVDLIREELKDPNFPIEMINQDVFCSLYRYEYVYSVSEDIARTIDRFSGNSSIKVNIPDSYLTKFQKFRLHIYYKSLVDYKFGDRISYIFKKKQRISIVHAGFILANNEITNAWIKDGCPLRWGFEDKRTGKDRRTGENRRKTKQ